MKNLLIALIALVGIGVGCATVQNRYHKPDGSLNVSVVLSDARWGLAPACSSGYVPPADCALANDALDVADRLAATDTPGVAVAVRKVLVDFEARLAPDNTVRFYLDWVIRLLPAS